MSIWSDYHEKHKPVDKWTQENTVARKNSVKVEDIKFHSTMRMKPHEIFGLKWLVSKWHKRQSCIFADVSICLFAVLKLEGIKAE